MTDGTINRNISSDINPTVNGSSNLEIAQSNQDLIISKGRPKKRKWLVTGVIVLVAVGLVIAAIILLSKGDDAHHKGAVAATAAALNLEDYLNGRFQARSFNATWTSNDELIYSRKGDVLLLNLRDNTTKVLLPANDNLLTSAFDFRLSADGLYLLVALNYQKLYRHSYIAIYVIVDLNTGDKIELIPGGKPAQLVVWSPIGNSLVYVAENNIFYKKTVRDTAIAITKTAGYVSNGVPDWVNEEEVLSSNTALWFSPDGKKLAYARYNDTEVPLMVIPVYGEPGSLIFQYPRANVIKYPKSGTSNPVVTLHYVDLENPSIEYQLKISVDYKDQGILSAVKWATDEVVTAIWLNRVQNKAAVTAYDTRTMLSSPKIIANLASKNGWLELFTPPIFSKDGSKLILILSQDQGENAGGYRHIVLFNRTENAEGQPLTLGKFVVTTIVGWNHENNLIYYLANTESDSSVQHLYTVSPETKNVNCLSCDLKSSHNSSIPCAYNLAEFSGNGSYYVFTCAGPDVPHISIYDKDGKMVTVWTDNKELANFLKNKQLPVLKKLSFDVAGGFKANVLLRLPPNMDTSGQVKYPMLVNVYGGPDTYQVVDKFLLDWGSYLAANKSIIYAAIDGRGSGLRGDKIMFAGYRNLGTVEVADQINVTKLLQKTLPYVDASRSAIWGWSYGGYASGMALAEDTEGVFKCGISVAPVTDWTLYDSIYTERFMGLPTVSDNLEAYQKAQLLKNYEGIRNKEYFLIHGTHDDNVHYQQSMLWSKVLELKDILFRQQSYPDEDHSLGSVRPHLYHSLENFLDECFIKNEN
ncbi:venom dipeptidyl peptidase 4 isoform X1 [Diorhabda carinulata]|uniref:venom dipeptidyl peptidase 4 isoform X1 n=1 Tax=Diorhabda carinulata TaxID=1163345 RepID=UPI0025A00F3C|nr:venom dipeptidyl peptidase 4 isoform X1 [Diorhabda carinulata]XP_057672415.1 venom dipeptidyl peptidase 4 isoform X1 [Diorhabda carinulata]